MWWQLIEKLSDPVFLSWAVDVRHLLLWQAGEVDLDLTESKGISVCFQQLNVEMRH